MRSAEATGLHCESLCEKGAAAARPIVQPYLHLLPGQSSSLLMGPAINIYPCRSISNLHPRWHVPDRGAAGPVRCWRWSARSSSGCALHVFNIASESKALTTALLLLLL